MDVAEFDKFADEYLATHARNLRISGEDPEYFARYKIEELRRVWSASHLDEPRSILDFGSGIGASLPHLAAHFPSATMTALEVSPRSLAIAASRFPGMAQFVGYDGADIPLAAGSFDLIFSSCVFHHIPEQEHVGLLGQLRGLLSPGGRLAIFEHNPLNPVTRYIVASCEFDENAVLIPAPVFKTSLERAGFSKVKTAFTGFFPGALRALRPLERHMSGLPIGAQYYTLAHD